MPEPEIPKPELGQLEQRRDGMWVWKYGNCRAMSMDLQRILGYARTAKLGEEGMNAVEAVEQAKSEYRWSDDAKIQVVWATVPPAQGG